jgi:4'-phosphopantetheinyl transferase
VDTQDPINSIAQTDWSAPAAHPVLRNNEVHVWQACLEEGWDLAGLSALLDDGEKNIAARFRLDEDRDLYILSHGLCRRLLAAYIGVAPAALRFTVTQHGKPEIGMPGNASQLRFNMAHSGQRAIFAIASNCDVGVDVEHTASRIEVAELWDHVLCASEQAQLRKLPAAEQRDAFFRVWTRKEAALKAAGVGLLVPPATLDVLSSAEALINGHQWRITDLSIQPQYRAAVAAAKVDRIIRCWSLAKPR